MKNLDYVLYPATQSVYIRHYKKIVTLPPAVYQSFSRSLWREEKQDRVYHQRFISYNKVIDDCEEYIDVLPDQKIDLERDYIQKENLQEILCLLSKRQREVVEECILGGKSISEYAEEVGIPQSSASLYKKNALNKLRNAFEGEDYYEYGY